MKTDILNWRMWLIGTLAMVSLICIVSEPIDDETWWSSFFISKGIGFGTAYLIYRLVTYWSKNGLIQDFNEDEEV